MLLVLFAVLNPEDGVPDPNFCLCIPASAADATAVNPNCIKTLLANG